MQGFETRPVGRQVFWTEGNAGCYADGAVGHEYIRQSLAELLDRFAHPNVGELRDSLRSDDWPDDLGDEIDAIDYLNNYCEGCFFQMVDGDLMLVAEDPED